MRNGIRRTIADVLVVLYVLLAGCQLPLVWLIASHDKGPQGAPHDLAFWLFMEVSAYVTATVFFWIYAFVDIAERPELKGSWWGVGFVLLPLPILPLYHFRYARRPRGTMQPAGGLERNL
jgi:hypothetical protein